MNQNKPAYSIIGTGTVSIVLIFVMLCLLTFSVLSLVSAQADLRLSRLSAERTTEYYAAENAANDILIRIEAAAARGWDPGDDAAADYAARVLERLEGNDGVTLTSDGRLAYRVPLGENQALYVELLVSPRRGEDGYHYTVCAWQTVSGYDWAPDDSLPVALPGSMPTGLE